MKKIIPVLLLIILSSCADVWTKSPLIVSKVEKRNVTGYPEYYVNIHDCGNGEFGFYTDTNYRVGDTLK